MISIALFGTSADPPTTAHQEILVWLSHHFDEVAVWASDNPFKPHQTPLVHRTAMLQLMVQDINPVRHNIHVYPELSSPRALITVKQARQQWKGAAFTLVVGSDLVVQLPQWYRVEVLLKQVKLLVVPRPGYALSESDLRPLRQMGATVAIAELKLTGVPVSSTAFRETGAAILTPPIEAYIQQKCLYTVCQDDFPKNLLTPSPIS